MAHDVVGEVDGHAASASSPRSATAVGEPSSRGARSTLTRPHPPRIRCLQMKRQVEAGFERFGDRFGSTPPLATESDLPGDRLRLRIRPRALFAPQNPPTAVLLRPGRRLPGVSSDPLHAHVVEGGWHGVLVEPQPSTSSGWSRTTPVGKAPFRERRRRSSGGSGRCTRCKTSGATDRLPCRPRVVLRDRLLKWQPRRR